MFHNDPSGWTRNSILGGDFTTQIPCNFNQLCQTPNVGQNPYLGSQVPYGTVSHIPQQFFGQTPYTTWNQNPYTMWNQTPYHTLQQMWNQNPFYSSTNPYYGTGNWINCGVPGNTSMTPAFSGTGINHPFTGYSTVPNTTFGYSHFNSPVGHQQMICR